MTVSQNKDAHLKRAVKEVLERCQLDALIVDREVHVNFSGDKDAHGNYESDKEIDVVGKFSYGGKKVLLLFECEDSSGPSAVKAYFNGYNAQVKSITAHLGSIQVVNSADKQLKGHHFKDVDLIGVCFIYGRIQGASYQSALKEARRYPFVVWNRLGLTYYQKISSVLNRWTKYELFRDFGLDLEVPTTFTISALKVKQKGKEMYLGRIHPGQFLRIAYVVRRASEKTYAFQRMLSKSRIDDIAQFISSDDQQSFLPNAVIAVFDNDPGVQTTLKYDEKRHELTIPMIYCSAWIIDGQHRAYGFLGTLYENWSPQHFEPFDLPVILFRELPEVVRIQTFININYFQKRIKASLLCDLTTLTKDMNHKLTWPSLIGRELTQDAKSPLHDKVAISELHTGRSINLSSLVQYGLLETLLGYKKNSVPYTGPLFKYAHFDRSSLFDSSENQKAFRKQVKLLIRFLDGVKRNTQTSDSKTDPWQNTREYSLLKPTGLNALFMVLARILQRHEDAGVNFDSYVKALRNVSFKRTSVAKMGGGWKGFRGFANAMIKKLNKDSSKGKKLKLYGEKQKT